MPFSGLAARVQEIRGRVAAAVARGGHDQAVELVAVTKTYGPDAVLAAWDAGVQRVGENRVQEALEKMDQVDVPVEWHLIGHLQRNKARHAGRFALVHSVDSLRLAEALSAEGVARGRPLDVLVQVNVSGEQSKGGFAAAELEANADVLRTLRGVVVRGVMTMAPLDASEGVLRQTFGGARAALGRLQVAGHASARELSMGMSSDFEVAVEEGATMIRLGSILFGARA
ncbi:MAG: YggS family pyridoxal phosphate-dependent enzyme [Gemmatimonadaceae bacterium]|nr:YggS family pyridoxal phosphate-dependent enzyme [Gemmatimonadaceae bacterium]